MFQSLVNFLLHLAHEYLQLCNTRMSLLKNDLCEELKKGRRAFSLYKHVAGISSYCQIEGLVQKT